MSRQPIHGYGEFCESHLIQRGVNAIEKPAEQGERGQRGDEAIERRRDARDDLSHQIRNIAVRLTSGEPVQGRAGFDLCERRGGTIERGGDLDHEGIDGFVRDLAGSNDRVYTRRYKSIFSYLIFCTHGVGLRIGTY